jgi:hypothetical protein
MTNKGLLVLVALLLVVVGASQTRLNSAQRRADARNAEWAVQCQQANEDGYALGLAQGKKIGAKIAMNGPANSLEGYRLEEVRGSCDTDALFSSDECGSCHK